VSVSTANRFSVFAPLLKITLFCSRVYQTLLLAKPIWLQKLTMVSHVLAHVTTECPDVGYSKLKKYVSEELTPYSYQCIPLAYVVMHCMI